MFFMTTDLATPVGIGFHHACVRKAEQHRVALLKMAESAPEKLAALLRANPRMLNWAADVDVIAKAMSDAGYKKLCDDIAGDRSVTRDVREAFKGHGEVDWLTPVDPA